MGWKIKTAFAVMVIGSAGFVAHSQGYLGFLMDSKLLKICEDQLKERLRSPSTYVRYETSEYSGIVPVSDLKKFDDDISMTSMRAIEEGRYKPTNYKISIKYEAANAYGTPVAGISICEYFSVSGRTENIYSFQVKIDGESNHDRLIRSVLEQRS